MGSLETLRVANFSRAYGNSSLWEFGVEMLAPKSKMGSHFLASVLYPVRRYPVRRYPVRGIPLEVSRTLSGIPLACLVSRKEVSR